MNHASTYSPQPDSSTAGVSRVLSPLVRAVEQVSATALKAHQAQLLEMRGRLDEERFHLAVLGQFKRGKSTLLNALLGEKLLPTAVIPMTAIPTLVRADVKLRVRVEFTEDRPREEFEDVHLDAVSEILPRFVGEEGNPKNRLGVSRVEVFHPAPILRDGVVLIDTPGIGSTYVQNTVSTLQFLPQCDAALFVLSADPPMTQVELEFLREVRDKVARLFFILNKVDYLSEEDRGEAVRFLKRVLRDDVGINGDVPVLGVSARQGLEAKLSRNRELWTQSGMAE